MKMHTRTDSDKSNENHLVKKLKVTQEAASRAMLNEKAQDEIQHGHDSQVRVERGRDSLRGSLGGKTRPKERHRQHRLVDETKPNLGLAEEGHGGKKEIASLPSRPQQSPQNVEIQPSIPQSEPSSSTFGSNPVQSPRVHVFHYGWYEAPPIHKNYAHWNHKQLPHWLEAVNQRHPHINERYDPTQGEIGSVFYPELGLYSSSDRIVMKQQFQWMKEAGIGTMVLSWWGREGKTDGEGQSTPLSMLQTFFEEAAPHNVKIAFHLEPYDGRTEDSVREDIQYLLDNFGDKEALFRVDASHLKFSNRKGSVPVFYVYDSYHIPSSNWARILNPDTPNTIRNTKFDAVMLSLYISPTESDTLVLNGFFDGVYTYFVSKKFTYGSNPNNWKVLNDFCEKNHLVFSPSIGPGYNDIRVRPWNQENIQSRANGDYYRQYFDSVKQLSPRPAFVSITSMNEWHEGTNIEPARSYRSKNGYEYETYTNKDPEYYLKITNEFAAEFDPESQG